MFDAVGSNIVVGTRAGEVMRILPRANEVHDRITYILSNTSLLKLPPSQNFDFISHYYRKFCIFY